MGFSQGLSGLQAASSALDTTGNNIANSQTVGFKSGRSEFADLFAGKRAGLGVQTSDVKRNFTDGALQNTGRNLDVAIAGDGFFRLNDGQQTVYSRNGSFNQTKDGFIENAQGAKLTGYNVTGLTTAGGTPTINTGGTPQAIQIPQGGLPAKATSDASQTFALDAGADIITSAFDPTDSSTYNTSSPFNVYDSQGNAKNVNLYFTKNSANNWTVNTRIDGQTPSAGDSFGLAFNGNGTLATVGGTGKTADITFDPTAGDPGNGANSPQSFTLDFTGSTQTAQEFSTSNPNQNGYQSGKLAGIQVSDDGKIRGSYSNGQSVDLAQVALAKFGSNQGLKPVSGNGFVETSESGQPAVGPAGSGGFGSLNGGKLEKSNVDLSQQLVKLIVQQRNYQANAKTIKTQGQVLQTAVNLG